MMDKLMEMGKDELYEYLRSIPSLKSTRVCFVDDPENLPCADPSDIYYVGDDWDAFINGKTELALPVDDE